MTEPDSAALEDERFRQYMAANFGLTKLAVGAPPSATPNADPAASSEPDSQATEDAQFATYMRTHFPGG